MSADNVKSSRNCPCIGCGIENLGCTINHIVGSLTKGIRSGDFIGRLRNGRVNHNYCCGSIGTVVGTGDCNGIGSCVYGCYIGNNGILQKGNKGIGADPEVRHTATGSKFKILPRTNRAVAAGNGIGSR